MLGLAGCQASIDANVNTGTKSTSEVADFDKPMAPSSAPDKTFDDAPKDTALLGARQDLSFRGPATTTCKCLAVAVGQPGGAAFHWSGERPHTNPGSQLVIALQSAGIACPEAGEKATGASYWGYEVVNNDVVVVVERASSGRPVASGGIIPRPLGNGQVYVRPDSKKLPYGLPASGPGDRCQIGSLEPIKSTTPAPSPSSGVRIRTDEADPTSSRTEMH